MCGICGIYNEKNAGVVTAMLESIRHRGPDSFATLLCGSHSLGQCGLHIVGSGEDVLPLEDKDTGVSLVFNGEIYNHQELRKELSREGWFLGSGADSEVIIPLYKKYGDAFVDHLKGMFAIAIIDEGRILLARDRFGIKPLYYHVYNTQLIFGSEIKALLQHPVVPAQLNIEALEELTVFGYVYSDDQTLFKDIFQVPPGTVMTFNGKELTKRRYYSIPDSYYLNDGQQLYRESFNRLEDSLTETISLFHKHGTQDKGIYLSGGVDSSLMAILSHEILGRPVATYTLYDSEETADFNYARRVSKAIGSDHHEIFVSNSDYLNELPRFVYHYESIMAGGIFDIQGALAFHIASKHVSKRHKVAFTGEGADELFGGYYWIYTHPLGFADRIKKRALRLPNGSKARMIADEIFPYPEEEALYRRHLFDILMKTGLSNCHLWSVDRSSASFGFEARPPYLYDDLAQLALSFPIDFKVPDKMTTKKIMKDVALRYLDKYDLSEIAYREKCGMPSALEHIAPKVTKKIGSLVGNHAAESHPYSRYLTSPTDVLMFDLFFYFMIHKRGCFDEEFLIQAFYKNRINEGMYH